MTDKDKEPSEETDKPKKNPETGESSAPYGSDKETPSTEPAKDRDRDVPSAG